MKTNKLFCLFILSFFVFFAAAQSKGVQQESFLVTGNCGMCKATIEKAAKSVEGVKKAKWNAETQMIQVKFNADKTAVDDIQQAIAAVGYDTPYYRANDEVYAKLHSCCQYERTIKYQ